MPAWEAATLAQEAYIVSLELGSRGRSGLSRLFYGTALEHLGEFSEAKALIQEGLALARELGNHIRHTQLHTALVKIELHQGRYQEARDLGKIGLALAERHGPRFSVGLNLLLLGCLDLAGEDFARALEHIQASIAIYREYVITDDLSWGLAVLALAARALGRTGEATQHLLHASLLRDPFSNSDSAVCARIIPLASHGNPWQHSRILHHCDTQRQ